jgi:hypothetical protein
MSISILYMSGQIIANYSSTLRTHAHTLQGIVVAFVCRSHHILPNMRPTPCAHRGNERKRHMPRAIAWQFTFSLIYIIKIKFIQ